MNVWPAVKKKKNNLNGYLRCSETEYFIGTNSKGIGERYTVISLHLKMLSIWETICNVRWLNTDNPKP